MIKLPNIEGWMVDGEREWLYAMAQKMESVIEIGCWKGRSTAALAMGCKGQVVAVDHWNGSETERATAHQEAVIGDVYAQFLANMKPFGNVVPVRMASVEAASVVEPADMVFIDAGHEYAEVLADIIAWRPKARKLLCGHDYPFESVKRAVHEVFGNAVKNPISRIWTVEIA